MSRSRAIQTATNSSGQIHRCPAYRDRAVNAWEISLSFPEKKLLRILCKNGHSALRKKGSHVFVESTDSTHGTVVPIHGNEDLGTGLLKSILNDLDLKAEDLKRMVYGSE